jgi:perosamine synthetase
MPEFIPVYRPSLRGREREYVEECLTSTWISSKGRFLPLFEDAFRDFVGVPHATAVANGTVALHLALLALDVGPGDEVLVPTLTYIASVNAIHYVGATPVFVDSDPVSWNLDPADVERKVTARTRAIMVVHLYGHPADMDALGDVARRHGLFVIEDCAEAFGSRIEGRHVGTFGDVATFSFFGNKTVTTGEGGMVVARDGSVLERAVHFKTQGLAANRTYWHDVVGYNYRMTNICAAIGLAQMERASELVERKRALAALYERELPGLVHWHRSEHSRDTHAHWMVSCLVPAGARDAVRDDLAEAGIETRPLFSPAHTMPMYLRDESHPVAEDLSRRGINLPSWPDLADGDVRRICAALARSVERRASAPASAD